MNLKTKLLFFALILPAFISAQNIILNATGGVVTATYPTLNAAFININNGTHSGIITIQVVNNTNEGGISAILNASGTGPALYTRVRIFPVNPNLEIAGTPPNGEAVIRLDGADNVAIIGNLNGIPGAGRSLTIRNNSPVGTVNTAGVWLKSSGATLGCVNDSLVSLKILCNDNSSTSSFAIFSGGAVINNNGLGGDNDYLLIRNCELTKASFGIYHRGSPSGINQGFIMDSNVIGSNTPNDYISYRGLDLQYAASAAIKGNEIFNIQNSFVNIALAIDLAGGTTNAEVFQNKIHGIHQNNSIGQGAIGIMMQGTGNVIYNNAIYDIMNISSSTTDLLDNAFGIRVVGGASHKIYYNSIHLYGNMVGSTASGMAACIVITSAGVSGLEIRNNIFQNKMVSNFPGSKMHAIAVSATVTFGSININNNGYFIPPTNNITTNYYVGFNINNYFPTLATWQAFTGRDAASLPPVNQLAPFVADNDLHITGNPVIVESAGFNVAPVINDIDGDIRQGNAGYTQVPAGTAPDIGVDEIASTPGDFIPPNLVSVTISPPMNQCDPTSHTVQANVTDVSGLSSVQIIWTKNGFNQTNIPMPGVGNIYTGVIPSFPGSAITWQVRAIDASPQANTAFSTLFQYTDAFLDVYAGPDDSICPGMGGVNLLASTTYGGNVKFTEITLFRTGAGATNPYPPYVIGADLVEISNIGDVPVDMSGYTLEVSGDATISYVFPSGTTLPENEQLILHLGSGTDNAQLFYYNTGGTNDLLASNSGAGFILRDTHGRAVDVTTTNAFAFIYGNGVTSFDWAGAAPNSTNKAGIIRTNSDNNNGGDWVSANSPSPLQNIADQNAGLNYLPWPAVVWNPGNVAGPGNYVNPGTTTAYYATIGSGGCYKTDTVVIHVIPAPAIPTGYNDTICGLDTVHLQASGAGTIEWYQTVGGPLLGTGNNFDYITAANIQMFIVANNGVCSSPAGTVWGISQLASPLTVTANDSAICSGDAINLNVTSPNLGYNYNWTGYGLAGNTGANVTALPDESGYYYVYATDGDCSNLDSIEIIVNRKGEVNITFDPTGILCYSDTVSLFGNPNPPLNEIVTFTNTSTFAIPDNNVGGVSSYITVSGINYPVVTDSSLFKVTININHTWDEDLDIYLISPGGTDTLELSTDNGTSGHNYTYTNFTTDAASSITSGIAPFTGDYLPEGAGGLGAMVGATPNGNWRLWVKDDYAVDVGSILGWSIAFRNNNPMQFEWTSNPPGFSANGENTFDNPTTSTLYYFTMTDSVSGCSASDTAFVEVGSAITVSTFGDTSICFGGTANFGVNVSGGTGIYIISWDHGLGNGMNVSDSPTQNTSYHVIVSDNCGMQVFQDSVTIQIFENIIGGNISGDTFVCQGGSTQLSVSVSGGDGNYDFSWNNGVGFGNPVMVSPTVPTTYTVTITDGCGFTGMVSQFVDVYTVPVANFTWSNNGYNVEFQASASAGSTFIWDFGDFNNGNGQMVNHPYPDSGLYSVILIVSNPCGSDTFSSVIFLPLGTENLAPDASWFVSPNPATGSTELYLNGFGGEQVEISLISMQGVTVLSGKMNVISSTQKETIDLAGLAAGVYIIELRNGNARASQRIVLQ